MTAAALPATLDRLSERLDAAYGARTRIDPPPELAALDAHDAYAVQDRVVARRLARGLHVSGWKLGNTSFVKQRVMGFAAPLFGRLFAEGAVGTTARFDAYIGPRTEPELALGLRAPLTAEMDRGALLAAIAWIAPALEITDSRFTGSMRTANELIADNTSAAGYAIGEPRPLDGAPPLDAIATTIRCNGAVVFTGSTRDVLDDPLNGLALLAAHAARRGATVGAGDIILSGAITDAFALAPGDRVEAELAGIGSVAVAFG